MPAEETTLSLYFVTDMNNTSMVKFIDSQTGALLDLQLVAYGSTRLQPADPFKAGYEFTGWYNEAGEPFDFAKTVDTAVTLVYAKFAAENYTLQFDTAGGTPSYIAAIQTQYGALERCRQMSPPATATPSWAGRTRRPALSTTLVQRIM